MSLLLSLAFSDRGDSAAFDGTRITRPTFIYRPADSAHHERQAPLDVVVPGGTTLVRRHPDAGDVYVLWLDGLVLVRENEIWFLPPIEAATRPDFIPV